MGSHIPGPHRATCSTASPHRMNNLAEHWVVSCGRPNESRLRISDWFGHPFRSDPDTPRAGMVHLVGARGVTRGWHGPPRPGTEGRSTKAHNGIRAEGALYESPGQRPGYPVTPPNQALKGRPIPCPIPRALASSRVGTIGLCEIFHKQDGAYGVDILVVKW